jgi:hypothetical protein
MGRSRETLATLVILLMIAIAVLIPAQPRGLLGAELLLGGLVVMVRSGQAQLRTLSLLPREERLAWARRTVAVFFPWAIINAWVLVVRAGQRS